MKCKSKVRLALTILIIISTLFGLFVGISKHSDVSIMNVFHEIKQSPEDLEGWNLSLLMYDSTIDGGRTSVNSVEWNATNEDEIRHVIVQVNLSNANTTKEYAPGELTISVDSLGKIIPTGYVNVERYVEARSIAADKFDKEEKEYDWSYKYNPSNSKIFLINNNAIEAGASFESTIQMAYSLGAGSVQNGADVTIDALLNEELSSINTLNYKCTTNRKEGKNFLTCKKIISYDGLIENATDFIWTRFLISSDFKGSNVREYLFDSYIDINVPDGCVLLDPNINPILPDENNIYKLYEPFYLDSGLSTTNYDYYYMGFPKSMYTGQTVELTSNWCGKFCDSNFYRGDPNKEIETISSVTQILNLKDFEFEYNDNLYVVDNAADDIYASYPRITNEKYGQDILFYISGKTIYTGHKYKARYGDDLLYITDSTGDYTKLTDNEYYFKSIEIPADLYNGNNQIIAKDKYDIDLYVRYRGNNSYVKYGETFKNGTQKLINFNQDEFVVGWYIEIYDLQESLLFSNYTNISRIGIKTIVNIQKSSGILEDGRIYNLDYLQVFNKIDNDYIYINKPDNESYYVGISDNLSEDDYSNYGVYLQRKAAFKDYDEDSVLNRISLYMPQSYHDMNNFYRTVEVHPYIAKYSSGTEAYDGYRIYTILPEGTELNTTVDGLFDLITIERYGSLHDKVQKQDGSGFTIEEMNEFLKNHLTITVDTNFRNTGKTWIEFKEDFTDDPLNLYGVSRYQGRFPIIYTIPVKIPYESYYIYGSHYTVNSYIASLKDDEPYKEHTFEDVDDIDNDGYTTDFYSNDDADETYIVPAVSSYQEASIGVLTENTENRYVNDFAVARTGGEYKYRLKVRTGVNELKNLQIYCNIESESTNWRGTFDGVDTSFAISQGYSPKVYVSNSINPGPISQPWVWREYDPSANNSRVKSVAIDYGNEIIPSSFLTFVEIKMKAPTNSNLDTVTKNKMYTKWKAIDVSGIVIDDDGGLTSNFVYVGLKKTEHNISVQKQWNDNNNEFNIRPSKSRIHLLRNNVEIRQAELTEANDWSFKFTHLRFYDDNNNKYEYKIYEEPIDLYDTNIQYQELNMDEMTQTITTTSTPKDEERFVSIMGNAIWEDNDNLRGKRPSSVTIDLYRDGEKIDSTTTDANSNWYYEFTHLLKWKNIGEEYNYSIEEIEDSHYDVGYAMTHAPATGSKLKFSYNSITEDDADYVEIYYRLNGEIYKAGRYSGANISNKEIKIPTNDLYIYWHTDSFADSYFFGFSIDYIEPISYEGEIVGTISTLPDIDPEEIEERSDGDYPQSEHDYFEDEDEMWHYTLENPLYSSTKHEINITNTYKLIPATVLVHHYLDGTTTNVVDDEIIDGYLGDNYEALPSANVPTYYEVVNAPSNATGEFSTTQKVVTYYYKIKDYPYRIEYYYDGIIDNSKTDSDIVTYGTIIDTYDEKIVDGYVFINDAGKPLTITENVDNNVIKVYYERRTDLNYIVHYKEEGSNATLAPDKNVENQKYLEEVTEEAIDIAGYNQVNPTSQTIAIQLENNEITFYYTKRNDLSYIVHYNEQGSNISLAGDKIVNNKTYLEEITEEAINIEGYNQLDPATQTITMQLDNNVITFYYTKRTDLYYTIHYKEQGTDKQIADDKVVGNQVFGTTANESAIEIYGYNLLEPTSAEITITARTNEYTFYYQEKEYNYRVEYYYNNKIDDSKTDIKESSYNAEITTYEPKEQLGYKFDRVEGLPLTISGNSENDIIKVFYIIDEEQRKDLHYSVVYYKDNVLVPEDTIHRSQNVQVLEEDIIEVDRSLFTDENKYYGYKINTTKPSTVPGRVPNETIINVFYIQDETMRKDVKYTIEYYKNGILTDTDVETDSVQILQPDTIKVDKERVNTINKYENYILDYTDPEIIPDVVETDAVIKIYYIKRNDLQYVIHYKDEITGRSLADDKVVQNQTFGDKVQESAIDIVGYDKVNPADVEIEITSGANEYTFYYNRAKFDYTVEYYYDNVIDASKTEQIESLYNEEITSYTDNIKEGYKLDKVEGIPLTISQNEDENIIKVYYVIDPSQTKTIQYTVNYYIDNVLQENDIQLEPQIVQVLSDEIINVDKSKINITDKYEDCTFVETDPTQIPDTIENGGIIDVYYRRNKHPYSIEYYYNNIIDTEATESGQVYKGDIIDSYIDKNKEGYEFEKVEGLPLTISSTEDNVVKVYYLPIRKITINHIDKNTSEIIKTEEKTGKEGNTIKTGAEDFEGYILLEKPEIEEYTYSENEQIVNYYYAKVSNGVIEKHIDLISGKPIADDIHYDGYEGNPYTTNIKDIDGYKIVTNKQYYKAIIEKDPTILDGTNASTLEEYLENQGIDGTANHIPDNHAGNMTENVIEVRYYYVPITKLIVKYVDLGSGKEIIEKEKKDGEIGEEYTTEVKEIENYLPITNNLYYKNYFKNNPTELKEDSVKDYMSKNNIDPKEIYIPNNSKGTLSIINNTDGTYSTETIVTYYYATEREIVIRYYDYNTGKTLMEDVIKVGPDGEVYDFSNNIKEIAGYTLIKVPENQSGIYKEGNESINYYYAKNTQVVVKYVDKATGKELTTTKTIDGYVGKGYTTEKEDFDGYNYISSTNNTSGQMSEDIQEVVYYYSKPKGKIYSKYTINYIDVDTGKPIIESKEIDKQEVEAKIYTKSLVIDIDDYTFKNANTDYFVIKDNEDNIINLYYSKNETSKEKEPTVINIKIKDDTPSNNVKDTTNVKDTNNEKPTKDQVRVSNTGKTTYIHTILGTTFIIIGCLLIVSSKIHYKKD